jgi:hypothetical protein
MLASQPNNLIPIMKTIGKLLLLIFGTVWLVGTLYQNGRQKFDQQQLKINQQCESALPIFQQRYQTLSSMLAIYEKHAGMVNGIFTGNPNTADVSWDEAQSGTIATTRLCPELQFSEDIQSGLDQFNHGGSIFDKYQGALIINDNLQTFIEAAVKCDEIRTNQLLAQFKSDLTATDPSATDACQAINAAIDQYNVLFDQRLTGFIAGRFNIQPVQRNQSQIVQLAWPAETTSDPIHPVAQVQ